MFYLVLLYFILFCLISSALLVTCCRDSHPSLLKEPIKPKPGETNSIYFAVPNNTSKDGRVSLLPPGKVGSVEGVKTAMPIESQEIMSKEKKSGEKKTKTKTNTRSPKKSRAKNEDKPSSIKKSRSKKTRKSRISRKSRSKSRSKGSNIKKSESA